MAKLRLTTEQKAILRCPRHHLQVTACPGSGKTTTLVAVTERWIADGVDPANILALSFSNSTVQELSQKLHPEIAVQTVHALGLSLLHQDGATSKLLQPKQALALLLAAAAHVQRKVQKGFLWSTTTDRRRAKRLDQLKSLTTRDAKLVLGLFDLAVALDVNVSDVVASRAPELSGHVRALIQLHRAYRLLKRKRGLINYGDMVTLARGALPDRQWPYTHVVVDELQDCTTAQMHLLTAIVRQHRPVLRAFGDHHQSIYGFAGAAPFQLGDLIPELHTLPLSTSQRLTQPVAALASAVAGLDRDSAIQSEKTGPVPRLLVDHDEVGQQNRVVRRLLKHLCGSRKGESIAVLARTNAQLRMLAQRLRVHGVDATRLGLVKSRLALRRVQRLLQAFASPGTAEARQAEFSRLLHGWATDEKRVDSAVKELRKLRCGVSIEGQYKALCGVYLRLIGGARENKDVRNELAAWEPGFRRCQTLDAALAVGRGQVGGVTLSTIHAAKGGEWDHVLLIGVTDGLLPIYHAKDEQARLQERNLLYVGVTRARKTLRMYHSPFSHHGRAFSEISTLLHPHATWLLKTRAIAMTKT